MLGTLVNALAVVAGSAVGVSLRRHIPEGMHEILMQGLGLAVLVIGMQMGLGTHNVLVVIISMAVGGVLDGVSSVAIGAALGAGVFLSAGTILIYQGALTLLATLAQGVMTPDVTREFTATGGLLVLGVGITLLRLRPVRVGNLLPALLVVVALNVLLPVLSSLIRSLGIVR